jgi:hypothetical protein
LASGLGPVHASGAVVIDVAKLASRRSRLHFGESVAIAYCEWYAAGGALLGALDRCLPAKMVVFWRAAGLTYLKYVSITSATLRQALKEPAKSQAEKRAVVLFRRREYQDGKVGQERG